MSTVTERYCDIHGCSDIVVKGSVFMNVKFTTEQNEGRSTEPYLEEKKLDLCEDHFDWLVKMTPIIAEGAKGHNKYYFNLLR